MINSYFRQYTTRTSIVPCDTTTVVRIEILCCINIFEGIWVQYAVCSTNVSYIARSKSYLYTIQNHCTRRVTKEDTEVAQVVLPCVSCPSRLTRNTLAASTDFLTTPTTCPDDLLRTVVMYLVVRIIPQYL